MSIHQRPGLGYLMIICLGCEAILLLGLGVCSIWARTPIVQPVLLLMAAHLPFWLFIGLARNARWSLGRVLLWATVLRALLIPAVPLFSDDIYRYLWDGRVLLSGINPFAYAPTAPELEALRDRFWPLINHPEVRTIYPPIAQLCFSAIAAAWAHPVAFKIAVAAADLAAVVVLGLIVSAGNAEPTTGRGGIRAMLSRPAGTAAAAYGMCPLVCVETAMSGHLEPLAILPLLLAILGGRLAWRRGLLVGLATGIKLIPLWIAPILGKRRPLFWAGMAAVLVAGYLPFAAAGPRTVESLGTFSRRWEGNAGGFALIKQGVQWAAERTADDGQRIRVPLLDEPARRLNGTFFSLHKDSQMDPAAPGSFPVHDFVLACAKLVAGAIFVGIFAWAWRRRLGPARFSLWVFGAFIALTPVMHPWYLMWVLPFAALRGCWPWYVFAAVTPLAYLPLDGWWQQGVWRVPAWVPWVEWGTLAVLGLVYILRGPLMRVRLVERVLLK